ncbi:hypothetical protein T440DRAFT_27584 [Plenodomus tracheiphilus IPT5]|uniref:Malate dehydrogenase n=1 Tax=Plenodomus tracheiphilus IPT5 TaxID=1408161 RepID=A0A6A7AQ38_9PLEO|nr:hypothetical protein T440DRAFT_27584 [Plenodomus tracheiphilus IPT5]
MQPFTIFTVLAALAILTGANRSLSDSYVPAIDLDALAKLMPESALPKPSGLKLKYVLLGVGTQNYTCTSGKEDDPPRSTGAVARLYDMGTCLQDSQYAAEIISFVSPLALSLNSHTQHLDLILRSHGFQQILGHHFFHLSTPVFALDRLSQTPYPLAQVSKLGETEAPPSTFPGASADANVAWLFLQDTHNISRGGIDTVYRIETAGGKKPATCRDRKPSLEVDYAAQCKKTPRPKGKSCLLIATQIGSMDHLDQVDSGGSSEEFRAAPYTE